MADKTPAKPGNGSGSRFIDTGPPVKILKMPSAQASGTDGKQEGKRAT